MRSILLQDIFKLVNKRSQITKIIEDFFNLNIMSTPEELASPRTQKENIPPPPMKSASLRSTCLRRGRAGLPVSHCAIHSAEQPTAELGFHICKSVSSSCMSEAM